jgi:hypothetical protein
MAAIYGHCFLGQDLMANKSEKETGICRGYSRMEFTGILFDRVISRSKSFIRVLQNLLSTEYFNLKFFINISGEIGRNFLHPPYISKYTQVKKYRPVPAGYGDFPVSFLQDPVGSDDRNLRTGHALLFGSRKK